MYDISFENLKILHTFVFIFRIVIHPFIFVYSLNLSTELFGIEENKSLLIFVNVLIFIALFSYIIFVFLKIEKLLSMLKDFDGMIFDGKKVTIDEIFFINNIYDEIKKFKLIFIFPSDILFFKIISEKSKDLKAIYISRTVYRIEKQISDINLEAQNLFELYDKINTIKSFLGFISIFLKLSSGYLLDKQENRIKYYSQDLKSLLNNSQLYINKTLLLQYSCIVNCVKNRESGKVILSFVDSFSSAINIKKNTFNNENTKLSLKILQSLSIIREFFRNRITSNINTSLNYIDMLNGHQFEEYCSFLLKEYGFTNLTVTKGSGDKGVDIIAYLNGKKFAIQCKCYSNKLGNSPIQEVVAGKNYYGCNAAIVLTNNYFTKSAIELAEANNVLLWDREVLRDILYKVDSQWKELLEHLIKF